MGSACLPGQREERERKRQKETVFRGRGRGGGGDNKESICLLTKRETKKEKHSQAREIEGQTR